MLLANIKSSKTQFLKTLQSDGFLGKILGLLTKIELLDYYW